MRGGMMVDNVDGVAEAGKRRDPYIRGYFSDRIRNGEQPDYGYPENHLPEVGDAVMSVVSGFMKHRRGA